MNLTQDEEELWETIVVEAPAPAAPTPPSPVAAPNPEPAVAIQPKKSPEQKEQMRQIVIKQQLENICKCTKGKWYRTESQNSKGERLSKYIIEFSPEE